MNLKKRTVRNSLYNRTFTLWPITQKLDTIAITANNIKEKTVKFKITASDKAYAEFTEALGDIETLIEVMERTFPNMRADLEAIKLHKLEVLSKNGFKKNQNAE